MRFTYRWRVVFLTTIVMALSAGIQAGADPARIRDLSVQGPVVRGWVDVALGADLMPWNDAPGMVGGGSSHSTRRTMLYAAGLILRNHPEDLDRAHRAIRSVLKLQYDAPGKKWHGTYKQDELEPDPARTSKLERPYDENWREFIGTAQIVLLDGCSSRLDPALRVEMLAALRRACEGAHERAVSWRYTNIALMSAYLLSWGGRQFDNAAWSGHGAELAREVYTGFCRNKAFQEYNSPTYAGTDLYALALWRALPLYEEMGQMACEMEAGLWRDLARHYHAGLGNLCGPYDRSYGMDMRKYLAKLSICTGLALDLPQVLPDPLRVQHHGFEMGFAPLMAVLGMKMPEDAAAHFREFQGPRRFEQIIEDGEHPRTAQSWLEHNFMVGAEQAPAVKRPSRAAHYFTLHWKAPDNDVGWMRLLPGKSVEPRIVDDSVTFAATADPPGSVAFEVYAPGATGESFGPAHWDLPGMPISVDTRLTSPEITVKEGLITVRYVIPRTGSKGPILKLTVLATAQ